MSLLWAAVAVGTAGRAAHGIAVYFGLGIAESLLEALFLVFLLFTGFRVLARFRVSDREPMGFVALPRRAGWPAEFGVGAAIGWGACLVAVLPLLLTGHLHGHLTQVRGQGRGLAIFTATLLIATLAEELVFRGFPFFALTQAIGPSAASLVLSIAFGMALVFFGSPSHSAIALLDGALLGLLLAIACRRTQGLWVAWGLHFGYRSVMAIVIGLPIAGQQSAVSLVDMQARGPAWLTGGAYGVDGALLTALVLLAAIAVLYRATREWAWRYTYTPIVAAGYEVTIAPPAAHLAMENATPPPPPLVQILSATPAGISSGIGAQTVPVPGKTFPPA